MILRLNFTNTRFLMPIHRETGIFYVYAYIDPLGHIPFYIGKGKDNRWYNHLKIAIRDKRDCNMYKIRKIQKLIRENRFPLIIKL